MDNYITPKSKKKGQSKRRRNISEWGLKNGNIAIACRHKKKCTHWISRYEDHIYYGLFLLLLLGK